MRGQQNANGRDLAGFSSLPRKSLVVKELGGSNKRPEWPDGKQ